ncbi:phage tail assembly protein [Sphingomonas abietis]|uniref:Phage tail assembly protein n=1 Tax=Sphingomonas abietis TaxID=3012344 RepID=A0ABY7NKE9_9SPHN|nr:phage tail assembly protein [Sphingomonas abietis]WBO20986.1 phage tail assembly protein [Sphingomonas abietis]
MREPTADEMMQWDSLSGTAADRKAIAIVAGVPEQVVGKMTARDFNRAARFIGSFLA